MVKHRLECTRALTWLHLVLNMISAWISLKPRFVLKWSHWHVSWWGERWNETGTILELCGDRDVKPSCDVIQRESHGANCGSRSLALQEPRWALILKTTTGSATITDTDYYRHHSVAVVILLLLLLLQRALILLPLLIPLILLVLMPLIIPLLMLIRGVIKFCFPCQRWY